MNCKPLSRLVRSIRPLVMLDGFCRMCQSWRRSMGMMFLCANGPFVPENMMRQPVTSLNEILLGLRNGFTIGLLMLTVTVAGSAAEPAPPVPEKNAPPAAVVVDTVGEAVPEELIRDGDTIVFFGDSITQGGLYIDHLEAYFLVRHPDWKLKVLNRGISSETISGTSEPDHDPRRPWAHERFTRDIVPLKPQVLFVCFGMNDGNYHPFEWSRFEKYQQGIRRLLQRAKEEAGVRTVILMTPPPFDAYQRKSSDPKATSYGYKYPSVHYDETLEQYASWLMSLNEEGIPVVDLHTALNDHVATRREQQVSFTVTPDAVHPDMTGHWLMARAVIQQLGLAPEVEMQNWDEPIPEKGWSGELPLAGFAPIDRGVDPLSIELESAHVQDFVWQGLQWFQAEGETRYRVFLDDVALGEFEGFDLQVGLTIPAIQELGIVKNRQKLLELVRESRTLEYWQFRAGADKPLGGKAPHADIPKRLAELREEIETLRKPVTGKVRVEVLP